jgi:enterochelin esterase-like enzyme
MKPIYFIFIGVILMSTHALANNMMSQSFFSSTLHHDWAYTIYLPKNYSKDTNKHYPVLFLLHGMYDNHRTFTHHGLDKILDAAIQKGAPEMIIVCPNGYGYSWWQNSVPYGALEDAFIKDLIPYIDYTYRTLDHPHARAIAGISMGGYGALRFSLKYPKLFSSCTLLSPATFYPLPGKEIPQQGAYPTDWRYSMVVDHTLKKGVFGTPFDPQEFIAQAPYSWISSYKTSGYSLSFYIYYGNKDPITDNATLYLLETLRQNAVPFDDILMAGEHGWDVWKQALIYAIQKQLFREYAAEFLDNNQQLKVLQ